MKIPIKILIVISLGAVLLLCSIQWYLVQTTFAYQSNMLEKKLTSEINDILEPYNPTDSLVFEVYDTTRALAESYKQKGKFRGQDFIDEVITVNAGKPVFGKYIKRRLAENEEITEFEYATIINYLGLNENGQQSNTFLFDTIMTKHRIEGALENFENAFVAHEFTHSETDFLIGMSFLVDISQQTTIIFRRMRNILIGAVLSILAVIVIFLYAIRALIQFRKEADRQKDFINNITHEFKTPMATIKLANKNLKNPKVQSSPAKIEKLADLIERQNERLQKLIDQAMESSSISQNLELKKERLAIHEFLANRIGDFKTKLEAPDSELIVKFDSQEIQLDIDPFHFTTMLYNLLQNAVKYSDGSPKMEVSTFIKSTYFELKIRDQGIGMNLKKGVDIFEKFYRIQSGNVHNVKGLGLGLFYVKKIVDAHDGKIRVESEVGKGTVFFIRFPLKN